MLSTIAIFMVFCLANLAVPPAEGRCRSRQFEAEGNICCDMCPPGTHVKTPCSAQNPTTVCEPCKEGTYVQKFNNLTECDKCEPDSYYNNNLAYCMECTGCAKGHHPVLQCTMNTQCILCPQDQFSDIGDNRNRSCRVCTTCEHYARNCTPEEDAVCGDSPMAVATTTAAITTGKPMVAGGGRNVLVPITTVKSRQARSNAFSTKTIIFISLLVVVTVILICVVVVVLYAKKSRCQRGRGFLGITRAKYVPLGTGLLLRNQPAHVFLRVVEMLNPEGRPNWKDLAAEFRDFSWDEIANFAVDKATAAERMLGAWQTKNSATVDRLHHACVRIQREDVATYISDYVNGASDTPV